MRHSKKRINCERGDCQIRGRFEDRPKLNASTLSVWAGDTQAVGIPAYKSDLLQILEIDMTKDREEFESWYLAGWGDGADLHGLHPLDLWMAWQASRKQACDQVAAHFENYTNPVAGHILAEQVREILK